jgi:hypothetical protein
MVEFAIICMILFMMFFALLDLGIVEIGNSASGNAAREGARIGALYPYKADIGGQPSNTAVIAAVNGKLAGLIKNVSVAVVCQGPDATTTLLCANAKADRDLIKVSVTYTHKAVSPFIKTKTRTESATMVVVGSAAYSASVASPTTTTTVAGATTTTAAPTHCVVGSISLSTSTATVSGTEPNVLTGPVTLTATTISSCNYLYAILYRPGPTDQDPPDQDVLLLSKSGDTYTRTIDANDFDDWRTGEANIRFIDFFGEIEGATTSFRVSSPGVCSVVSAGVNPPTNNPPSVVLASTTEPAALATGTTVQVNVTSTAACGNIYASFTPGASGTAVSTLMSRSGTSYTLSLTAAQYATWTAGLKVFAFTDGVTPIPAAYKGPTASFQVNAPPPSCNVSVSFTNTSGTSITSIDVANHGQQAELNQAFNVTVAPTGTCSLPIYARWDRGFGYSGTVGQAALSANTYQLPVNEGGDKSWAQQGGTVTFRFYNGVPGTSNQLTPLSPVTLSLV